MSNPQDKQQTHELNGPNIAQDWDSSVVMKNISFLEQKIHQLRNLVQIIDGRRGQVTGQDEILVQQQYMVNAELTSIIVQLISTAGSLLSSWNPSFSSQSSINQLGQIFGDIVNQPIRASEDFVFKHNNVPNKVEDHIGVLGHSAAKQNYPIEDQDMKSDDDAEGENLPPGSYEILQLEKEEILAPHTHFCTICGKGFKRDANLRMHMRGHGDEYKTPAALAKPNKESGSEPVLIKRYSCPVLGCKRNKDHKKFQPLKTILCVKNHYKRTHCDKTYICSRCNAKKFSVIADLKTHEKHCGRDKWLCSCGTTFSRKDKLFGHIALFQGHAPAIPVEECNKAYTRPSSDHGQGSEAMRKVQQSVFLCKPDGPSGTPNVMEGQGSLKDTSNYFSPLDFASSSSIGGFPEFTQPPFEDSEDTSPFIYRGL